MCVHCVLEDKPQFIFNNFKKHNPCLMLLLPLSIHIHCVLKDEPYFISNNFKEQNNVLNVIII